MRIKLRDVFEGACTTFDITPDEIRSLGRSSPLVTYRAIAMYLARKMTPASLQTIGAYFCRDHTTIVHACSKIVQETGACPVRDRQLEKCRQAIQAAAARRIISEQIGDVAAPERAVG